jgi:hypothetical protein
MYFSRVWLVVLFTTLIQGISIERGSLRANGLVDPIAIDTNTPRLSWRLESSIRGDAQTAYQVQAATSSDNFGQPDLWDTEPVNSTEVFSFYEGETLDSRATVYWRVRSWGSDGVASVWSDVSSFAISLLNPSDWQASWIANVNHSSGNNSLPLLAKEFHVSCPVSKARLYLLGLGVHAPEINGELVGDTVLAPGYTDINKTAFYSTYDVAELLIEGSNVLGVALGKGIYDADKPLGKRYTKLTISPQQLKLISQLEYTCISGELQTVVSDDTWVTTVDGPHIEAHWYGGEEYDARKEIVDWSKPSGDRSGWANASVTTGLQGSLVSPRSPQLKIVDVWEAVAVKKVRATYQH